ncbi:uncharacterized protein MONOS_13220 [Monocercomonoides exilis]|uniref:uncharacterized protein n=1 Tax=Monocercomonoides exilis TaxID=2049356 RepID=UPI00355A2867|nr:hypothetical protein MONOS_13220 [Monocercomonoides exilis]|eukprot:MONOS_13220.1-p1 / transcript=MONOS_13220.1 / gene=MONOS_13220 / organism=Monocercomonoides_exilis_PA203 / gene_product=unspecified product / transcript_product=unspecified product / location=Mono_scaffold00793:9125-10061(-) / protein_length=252 / sequence_SO=supercontig / SO=protein_coding / is_pseudo=false
MIADEDKKKERKNEKLLIDLCECYLLLNGCASSELISTCVPCLLKAASKKEENEETQKEVEIALLALSRINRLLNDKSKEMVIANELCFIRESRRELEELRKNVDWKKKEEEREKETKEELALSRWFNVIANFLSWFKLSNEELTGLISSIVSMFRAAKDNFGYSINWCIHSLRKATDNGAAKIDFLMKGGAIDLILEETQRQTLNNDITHDCLIFLIYVSQKLKEEEDGEEEEGEEEDEDEGGEEEEEEE